MVWQCQYKLNSDGKNNLCIKITIVLAEYEEEMWDTG
jgi:hypothetical protein